MRIIVLTMILASAAASAPALGKHTQELTHAQSQNAVLDVVHRQGSAPLTPLSGIAKAGDVIITTTTSRLFLIGDGASMSFATRKK